METLHGGRLIGGWLSLCFSVAGCRDVIHVGESNEALDASIVDGFALDTIAQPPPPNGPQTPSCNLITQRLPQAGAGAPRFLTELEIRNTAWFGVGVNATSNQWEPQPKVLTPLVRMRWLSGFSRMAAQTILSDPDNLSDCRHREECTGAVLGLIEHAWRRPLTNGERAELLRVYEQGKAIGGRDEGNRWVLEAGLFSPQFYLRMDLSTQFAQWPKLAYAARLSYLIAASPPSGIGIEPSRAEVLFDQDLAVVKAHEILKQPSAQARMANFMETWLALDPRQPTTQPMKDAFSNIVFQGDKKFSALIASPLARVSVSGNASLPSAGAYVADKLLCLNQVQSGLAPISWTVGLSGSFFHRM